MQERASDMMKSIAEAQKRDEERERLRAEEEERRQFELEQNAARKKFNMNEVNTASLDEDERILKHAGDEAITK